MTVGQHGIRQTVGLWREALRGIPQLTKDEWRGLDLLARWLIATRAAVLVMTLLSAAIAGIMAFRAERFDLDLWVIMTTGLLLAHATNNLVNDLTDHWTGVDRENAFRTQYGPQPVEDGYMTTRQAVVMTVVTGIAALSCGLYLVAVTGTLTLLLLGLGALFLLFYTWPLKHIGLGELVVFVVWGPLMVGGGYYVVAGDWSWSVVVVGAVYALGVTTVLFGKHIDKIPYDKPLGVNTLPVLLGERNARYTAIGLVLAQYGGVGWLVFSGALGWPLLVVGLALGRFRQLWNVFTQAKPAVPPDGYPKDAWPLWFVSFAFLHNRRFGTLFLAGLIADTAWVLAL
ncbi:MAG TPA: prenyltransferase [Acidimicrobiia bacterium]